VRVLGIDPGTRVVGWGVVERRGSSFAAVAHGVLKARASDGVPARLRFVHEGLRDLVRVHRPDRVAVEEAFFGVGARAALALGEGRGAALLAAALEGVPIVQFPPATVKKAVAGRGAADKAQVARMVQIILGMAAPPAPADASDALAVALCALQRANLPGAAP
jgi:crossover junction endodeoxyribonuclease RuvC